MAKNSTKSSRESNAVLLEKMKLYTLATNIANSTDKDSVAGWSALLDEQVQEHLNAGNDTLLLDALDLANHYHDTCALSELTETIEDLASSGEAPHLGYLRVAVLPVLIVSQGGLPWKYGHLTPTADFDDIAIRFEDIGLLDEGTQLTLMPYLYHPLELSRGYSEVSRLPLALADWLCDDEDLTSDDLFITGWSDSDIPRDASVLELRYLLGVCTNKTTEPWSQPSDMPDAATFVERLTEWQEATSRILEMHLHGRGQNITALTMPPSPFFQGFRFGLGEYSDAAMRGALPPAEELEQIVEDGAWAVISRHGEHGTTTDLLVTLVSNTDNTVLYSTTRTVWPFELPAYVSGSVNEFLKTLNLSCIETLTDLREPYASEFEMALAEAAAQDALIQRGLYDAPRARRKTVH